MPTSKTQAVPDPDLTEFLTGERRDSRDQVAVAMALMTEGQRAIAEKAMAHPDATNRRIGEVLTRWTGVKVGEQSVSRHRRGACSCPR